MRSTNDEGWDRWSGTYSWEEKEPDPGGGQSPAGAPRPRCGEPGCGGKRARGIVVEGRDFSGDDVEFGSDGGEGLGGVFGDEEEVVGLEDAEVAEVDEGLVGEEHAGLEDGFVVGGEVGGFGEDRVRWEAGPGAGLRVRGRDRSLRRIVLEGALAKE